MNRYLLSRLATRDLQEIWNYIALDSMRQANRFRDQLLTQLRRLAEMPSMGSDASNYAPGLLRMTFRKNYVIYYAPIRNGILVIRILHGARNHDALLGQ